MVLGARFLAVRAQRGAVKGPGSGGRAAGRPVEVGRPGELEPIRKAKKTPIRREEPARAHE